MSVSNSASYAEPASLSHPTRPGGARYRVFLSYSHADTKWARWLMRRLELYRVPRRFHGRAAPIGEVGWRIAPVFRDRDELPTTSDLGETIRAALRESATLVVICSPSSAKSRWVQEEILVFKRLHGEKRVFAFIIAGEPKVAGAADDCFSPALRVELGADGQISTTPAEVVAADARAEGDGPKLAFIRLVAGLLGVGFDELRQRELQRRNRRLMVITGCSLAGMALTFGLAVVAWQARNDARRRQDQAEDVFAFMLGDFRPELKKVGRLDLLDKVGDKAMAYFDALDARDVTDTTLARQAKALTQIGEIRMEQKDARYADAGRAFFTAYQRAAALAARHPKNGDMLFERAQAEYWIGFVHWRQRQLSTSESWLLRYRDTARHLGGLDPRNPRWQRELTSSHHNLAVLKLEREDLGGARREFLQKLAAAGALAATLPDDLQLKFSIADTHSWLGKTADRDGELREAISRYAAKVTAMEELVRDDPRTAHWRYHQAAALHFEASMLAITGEREAARRQNDRASKILAALVDQDRANRRWASAHLLAQMLQLRVAAEPPAVRPAADLRAQWEKLVTAEPGDHAYRSNLIAACLLEAECLRAAGADAGAAITRALEVGENLLRTSQDAASVQADCAHALVTAARFAGDQGDSAAANRRWTRALELVQARAATSRDWRILDPAARALGGLGRSGEARAIVERLARFHYQPLTPWPSSFSRQ